MLTCKTKRWGLAVATVTLFATVGLKPALADNEIVVSFRLAKWKSSHFDDAKTATSHQDTLRRIGCEVKQDAHKGHIDVSYRSPKWRQLSFKTDGEAHEWAHWLEENGFETLFAQPAQAGHLETVTYRLGVWKSGHYDRSSQAALQSDTLRMLGCEVKHDSHAGHHDVSYRCSQTRVIGVESHDDAHKWETWLQANGFETKHEHRTARKGKAPNRKR